MQTKTGMLRKLNLGLKIRIKSFSISIYTKKRSTSPNTKNQSGAEQDHVMKIRKSCKKNHVLRKDKGTRENASPKTKNQSAAEQDHVKNIRKSWIKNHVLKNNKGTREKGSTLWSYLYLKNCKAESFTVNTKKLFYDTNPL